MSDSPKLYAALYAVTSSVQPISQLRGGLRQCFGPFATPELAQQLVQNNLPPGDWYIMEVNPVPLKSLRKGAAPVTELLPASPPAEPPKA